jgi:hypothetical protein
MSLLVCSHLSFMEYKHYICFQLHEVAIVSSIQEAQKDNLRSFNNYMMQVLEVGLLLPSIEFYLCLTRANSCCKCLLDDAFLGGHWCMFH